MDAPTLYRLTLGAERNPDPWQIALATDAWPRVLIAPTGSGKTAAVTLGWAAHRLRRPSQYTPRRLIWCLPMRTLVEQTAEAVKRMVRRAGGRRWQRPASTARRRARAHGRRGCERMAGDTGTFGSAGRHTGHAAEPCPDARLRLVARPLANGVRSPPRGHTVGLRRGAAHGRGSGDICAARGIPAIRGGSSGARGAATGHPVPEPLDFGDPRSPLARHRRSSRTTPRIRRHGRCSRGAGRQTRAAGARRQETLAFGGSAGVAKQNRPGRLHRAARRCHPGRTPLRNDDTRDRQSRGPGAGASHSARKEGRKVGAGADAGTRPLAISSRRSPAGDAQGG